LTITPVILWFAWRDQSDDIPDTEPRVSANESINTTHSRKRKTLYNVILLLRAGVRLLSSKKITMSQAHAGQTYLANYCHYVLGLIDAWYRDRDGPIERCMHAVRWLPLSIDPFVDLAAVMKAGLEKDRGGVNDVNVA